ncbi:unnamed protein product [Medioppia subpectinata]|uniref:FOXO protein transactivation domain-containing protein n=1 Tax=Medioppia subpectinata TaxID=1979941 RepID=A0A7R9L025_9ACAR|nr:unnamed protein product [Medioppia subpectinata]CAG2111886.1 unnamed protein product [Medioppia subpectinata]
MINPDAKPGKAARRRATSMETQKYEKKRGRVKKKIEALKNGLSLEHQTPSPSSSVSEGLDMFPDSPLHHGFQLSPEFRPRASSNASSCGRLSPIPAVENDMHDSQVPPLSPLTGWSHGDIGRLYGNADVDQFTSTVNDQLVEMATTMKLGGNNAFLGVNKTSPTGQLSPANSHLQLNNTYTLGNYRSLTGYNSPVGNGGGSGGNSSSPVNNNGQLNGPTTNGQQSGDQYYHTQAPGESGSATTLTALNNVSGGAVSARSPSQLLLAADVLNGVSNGTYSLANLSPVLTAAQTMDTMAALTASTAPSYSSPQHQCTVQSTTAQNRATVMGHLLSLNNQLPNDLDLNFDSLHGGLECDVDSVIRHELSVDGSLDFNFATGQSGAAAHTGGQSSNIMDAQGLHHHHSHHLSQLHGGGVVTVVGPAQTSVSVAAHNTTMTTAPSSRSWVH